MSMRRPSATRLVGAVAFLGVVAAIALAVVPATLEGTANKGLQAFVTETTNGPLTPCPSGVCATGNAVWDFIYVSNGNKLVDTIGDGQFDGRDTVHNAFVVNSVEWHIFVDGEPYANDTFYPPPNAYLRPWADHWPSTVRCAPAPDASPCTTVGSPAVVPGEQAAVFFAGWGHESDEPNGTYVFRYTVHGTLNGDPVDLTASSRPIKMTD